MLIMKMKQMSLFGEHDSSRNSFDANCTLQKQLCSRRQSHLQSRGRNWPIFSRTVTRMSSRQSPRFSFHSFSQRIEHLESENGMLADHLVQYQVSRAQEAEEMYALKRELASLKRSFSGPNGENTDGKASGDCTPKVSFIFACQALCFVELIR